MGSVLPAISAAARRARFASRRTSLSGTCVPPRSLPVPSCMDLACSGHTHDEGCCSALGTHDAQAAGAVEQLRLIRGHRPRRWTHAPA